LKEATAEGRPAFGFVQCDETFALYGDDVFLHSTQVEEVRVGNRISFQVQVSAKGRPQAINLQILD